MASDVVFHVKRLGRVPDRVAVPDRGPRYFDQGYLDPSEQSPPRDPPQRRKNRPLGTARRLPARRVYGANDVLLDPPAIELIDEGQRFRVTSNAGPD